MKKRELQAINAKIALVCDHKRTLEAEVYDCTSEIKKLSERRTELLMTTKGNENVL